jgi:methionyl-tRNA formyltransferase
VKNASFLTLNTSRVSKCYSTAVKRDWRVLFFGTGEVALSSAKLLYARKDLISRFEVVCPPQKEKGISLPVFSWANHNSVPIHTYHPPAKKSMSQDSAVSSSDASPTPSSIDQTIEIVKGGFDIGVVVDFGYMLPSKLISAFPNSPILMHPSLLPQYRGASPIEYAIMNGDKESGVTVLDVAPSKFDAGAILASRSCALDQRASGSSIKQQLADLGAQTLVEVLEEYEKLQKIKVPQPLTCTQAPKLKSSDYLVNWRNSSTIRVYNQWRALGPLTTTLHGCKHRSTKNTSQTINVLLHQFLHPEDAISSRALDSEANPGSLVLDKPKNLLWVKTGTNWIAVKDLQVENGRRVIDAVSFANGIQLSVNPQQYFESTEVPL